MTTYSTSVSPVPPSSMRRRHLLRATMLRVFACAGLFAPAPALAGHAEARLTGEGRIETATIGTDTPGAVYQAGSIAKYACTIAVLRLVDRGLFTLDSPIGALVPELATRPAGDVPLRHVLANRSGLPDGLMPAFAADPEVAESRMSATEAAVRFVAGSLAEKPGKRFSYDLVNWIVVQAVIERATGKPLTEALDSLVLRPAGMGRSRVFLRQLGPGGQVPVVQARALPSFLACAGGLSTTPADLVALLRYPEKGGLMPPSLDALRTVTSKDEDYALGGRVATVGKGTARRAISWQDGSNGPFKSVAAYDALTDTGFAAMTADNTREAIAAGRDTWRDALPVSTLTP